MSPICLLIKPRCCRIRNIGTTNVTGGIMRGANTQKVRLLEVILAKRAREYAASDPIASDKNTELPTMVRLFSR